MAQACTEWLLFNEGLVAYTLYMVSVPVPSLDVIKLCG